MSRWMRWRNTSRRGSAATLRQRPRANGPPPSSNTTAARPVDGYVAPQLHTHVVFFNITETENGETRALQPQELYRTQQYATAVYRSELAVRLQSWAMRSSRARTARRRSGATARSIWKRRARAASRSKSTWPSRESAGAEAAQIAAHRTRDAKLALTPGRDARAASGDGRGLRQSTGTDRSGS